MQQMPPLFLPLKFIEDRIIGAFLLVLFLPVIAIIALAISIFSPGPIFFYQKRGGLQGKAFPIIKFRTMQKEAALDASVPQAIPNDPRLTALGTFLRRHSLDELPQLFNVVRGEMSLVGPRPHAVHHDTLFEKQCKDYALRFRVKPGLTGWAQVNGYRGLIHTDEDIRHRTECDNYYIDHWSPWLEIRILFKTLLAPLWARNAH